jgi:molybdopterin synthase sulfur carrier subunit
MTVRLMYFAGLREAVGHSSEALELPAEIATVGQLRAYLAARGGVWADHFAASRNLRAAVNQDMASADAAVKSGDEVAFFPPVTGG